MVAWQVRGAAIVGLPVLQARGELLGKVVSNGRSCHVGKVHDIAGGIHSVQLCGLQ